MLLAILNQSTALNTDNMSRKLQHERRNIKHIQMLKAFDTIFMKLVIRDYL